MPTSSHSRRHLPRLATRLAALLAAPLLAANVSSAWATECEVSMERAYQEAQARGWRFDCRISVTGTHQKYGSTNVVNFDSHKRLGCSGKTGYSGNHFKLTASFFKRKIKGAPGDSLLNGWKIHSYQVNGGNYTQQAPNSINHLEFTWTSDKRNDWTRRHITKLVLSKHAGNCNLVYNEAFGS